MSTYSYLTQFVIDRSGHTLVYAGVEPDGKPWREDKPVMGWALQMTTWQDGLPPETDIVPLAAWDGGSLRYEDGDGNKPICMLPPNPTTEERENAALLVAKR